MDKKPKAKGEPLGAPLTPEEIRIMDELGHDGAGTDAALKIALQFAANSHNSLCKRNNEHWDRLLASRGLPDRHSKKYIVERHNGEVFIFAREETDD